MRRKLRAALAFSLHDWWIFSQAWVLLLLTDWALRRLPFLRIRDAAAGVTGRRATQSDAARNIRRTQQLVDAAARHHLYPMTCLRQALVLQRLLGRQGVATELRFGVQKETGDSKLAAHAWLEYEGRPVTTFQTIGAEFAPLVALHTPAG